MAKLLSLYLITFLTGISHNYWVLSGSLPVGCDQGNGLEGGLIPERQLQMALSVWSLNWQKCSKQLGRPLWNGKHLWLLTFATVSKSQCTSQIANAQSVNWPAGGNRRLVQSCFCTPFRSVRCSALYAIPLRCTSFYFLNINHHFVNVPMPV